MRVFHVGPEQFSVLGSAAAGPAQGIQAERPTALPAALPPSGFLWVACERDEFAARTAELQDALQRWTGGQLVWLHVSDLLNAQLPSSFDGTSWYDLMVFHRLAARPATTAHEGTGLPNDVVDTRPVGFALFDRVLLTVHPPNCAVQAYYAQRLADLAPGSEARSPSRLPGTAAELMLRMVNHMVDSYLDLRRLLSRHLGALQQALLDPRNRFDDWKRVLDSRNALHLLEDTCEDQRSAVQEWLDTLDEWPAATDPHAAHERELLRVRTRDVLEHIERVLSHVRRLEHSSEAAVQMHFSVLSQRTNDIMRTLTVLTAVFLPLNLMTGFFGMNFEFLPLIHSSGGFWLTLGVMATVGVGLAVFFRRKRYLGR